MFWSRQSSQTIEENLRSVIANVLTIWKRVIMSMTGHVIVAA